MLHTKSSFFPKQKAMRRESTIQRKRIGSELAGQEDVLATRK